MQTPEQRRVVQFLAAHDVQLDDALVDYIAQSLHIGAAVEDIDDFLSSAAGPTWATRSTESRQHSLLTLLTKFKPGMVAEDSCPPIAEPAPEAVLGESHMQRRRHHRDASPAVNAGRSNSSEQQSASVSEGSQPAPFPDWNDNPTTSDAATSDPCQQQVMQAVDEPL